MTFRLIDSPSMTARLNALTAPSAALSIGTGQEECWAMFGSYLEVGRKEVGFLVGTWLQEEVAEWIDIAISELLVVKNRTRREGEVARLLSRTLWLTASSTCFLQIDRSGHARGDIFVLQAIAFFVLHSAKSAIY